MFQRKPSGERSIEITLFLIAMALTCLLYWVEGYKIVVLNLFHLPVVLAAFYLGRHRAGVLALVCVLLASAVAALDLDHFASASSPIVIGLAITVWAAVIGLNAIFVGTLSDERSRRLRELHDAYVGVIEVLSQYLKSADQALTNESKRIATLCERIAQQLHLSEKDIDDIRIAALLRDVGNIEVTARVIRRAVGDLGNSRAQDERTFHGAELVQSLASTLSGALPLIIEHADGRDLEFSDPTMQAASCVPLGAKIIRTACEYDGLVNGPAAGDTTPAEALRQLRTDLDSPHHPAVLYALERVVLDLPQFASQGDAVTRELMAAAARD